MPGPIIAGTAVPIRGGALGSGAGITWVDPVINRTTSSPPGSPTPGDRYIVAATATGAWAGQEDNVAEWNGATWEFTSAVVGLTAYVNAETEYFTYNGSAWVQESFGPHATTHEKGGVDEVTLENLLTASVAGQIGVSKADGSLVMKKYYIVEPGDDLVTILNGLSSNSFVWLADGTHTVASQINISGKSNISIRGSAASILDITYAGDNPIAITAPASDINFEGFGVLYNGGAGGQTPLFAPIGSGAAVINRLTVRNISANFATGGITFVRADGEDIDVIGLTVESNYLFGAATKGLFRWPIAVNRKLNAVRIMYNYVDRDTPGGSQGIAFYGAAGAEIEDVVIRGNTIINIQEQIWINDSVGTTKKIVMDVNNITFDGSGNSGPEITGTGISDVTIIGNIFDNTGDEHCLRLDSGTRFKVTNNKFINGHKDGLKIGSGLTDSTIDDNTASGCLENGIENAGDDIDIRNNTCHDNNGYGIAESAATDGCNYIGNRCSGNLLGDYSMHASSTKRTRVDREGTTFVTEGLFGVRQQVLYVAKHGSDANAGTYPDKPKLTIDAARIAAAALSPSSEATAITIKVLDDAEYDEDIIHTQWVNVYAPHATLKGKQTLITDSRVVARRFINDGAFPTVVKSGSGASYIEADEILSTHATLNCFENSGAGNTHVKANRIQCTTGSGNAINMTGGNLFIDAQWVTSGSGEAINMVAGGNIHGFVENLGTIKLATATSIARLVVGKCTGYNVGAGTILRMLATEVTGTVIVAATGIADVTIAGKPNESIIFAVSDETTPLTTGAAKLTFRMPYAFTLTETPRASVGTAPTGADLIVDINEGGVSILSTKLSIDATEKTSTTATTPAVISDAALADDAEITIDIDQIGSTIAGAGLKVTLIGRRT